MQILRHRPNLVGCSKQKRPVNTEDRGVIRNVLILQNVDAPILDVVLGHLRHGGGRSHAADKQQRSQNHPRLDRHSQIGKHGQRKRHQPDADVGLGELQQLRNLAPLAHVVGDDHQNPRQRRHRHAADQRRGKQQNAQQRERMDHPGHRRLRPRPNIGCRPRNGSRSRQPAKHRRENVGHTLSDEFDIRIVPVVTHSIGDHR